MSAEFVAAMEDVLDLYEEPYDPQRPTVCFDETSTQLIGESRIPLPARPGRRERFDYEYRRNGTRNLFMLCEPLRGWRHVAVTERRRIGDFAHQMRWLADEAYTKAEKIRVVLDNLNTHRPASLYETFDPAEARRILKRLEFHYTPKHGSWQLIGLEAIYRRPNTSKPNPGHKVYPYLLRGLEINRVNQVWATDITYIPMARGFLYLVAIMDWHSHYVLAWRLSNTLEVDFCVAALEEALSKGRPQIFNTDQGSQFTSEAFTSMLLAQGVQVSMDGRGRCMDNVFVERLWRSIKYEEVYLKAYQNGTEARKGIGAYLAFYNQELPHQALGYRSPGQVFQAVSPESCLLEHPRALPSDEGLRDTPAVDSLILASPLS